LVLLAIDRWKMAPLAYAAISHAHFDRTASDVDTNAKLGKGDFVDIRRFAPALGVDMKNLKWCFIVVLLAVLASPAKAQYYRGDQECWNPRAGHFEGVRPGEQQSDLDFRRCRPVYSGGYHYRPENNPSEPDYARECWNPRAGHFETVRLGERQDDLDFSRCRPRF
jgi:hypothetical protein